MKSLSAAIILLFTLPGVAAELPVAPPDTATARSVSGQFLVHALRGNPPPTPVAPPWLAGSTNHLELEPALLAVSAERVKQALERELGETGAWRGRIHLRLERVTSDDDSVDVVTEKLGSGWAYHVRLPQVVERQRFVRAMVRVILLEQANRRASGRSAEIPLWLSEGLTQQLLSRPEMELMPPKTRWSPEGRALEPTVFHIRRINPRQPTAAPVTLAEMAGLSRVVWVDPQEAARQALRDRAPLTVEELSWPEDGVLDGRGGEAFRYSVQLFVSELLSLKNGRECMKNMIGGLGQRYNWQTAFFEAFKPHFVRQLDLEKWWALQAVHFTGHDPSRFWSMTESWQRLEKILRTPVEVRFKTNDLPARTDVALQSVIRQWNATQQVIALKSKVHELELFRLRAVPELAELADEYRVVLANYLGSYERLDLATVARRKGPQNAPPAALEAAKKLDTLDQRRVGFRPPEDPQPVESAQNGRTLP